VNGESISFAIASRGRQQFGFERLDLAKHEKIIRHLLANSPTGIILLPSDGFRKIDRRFIAS